MGIEHNFYLAIHLIELAEYELNFSNVIFAHGLGKITDMEVGPDGNLYILSKYQDIPTIFKILPVNETK